VSFTGSGYVGTGFTGVTVTFPVELEDSELVAD